MTPEPHMLAKNLVVDLETTVRCPVGNTSGNPMWRGNKVIAYGHLYVGDAYVHKYSEHGLDLAPLRTLCGGADMVIGHNVKFDLLYIYRDTVDTLPRIWDTQLAAYLLSGQKHLYASLDELTAEYIGAHALKDDRIKAYWKAGMQTEDIPKSELVSYLEGDVVNTAKIFQAQMDEAEAFDILPLMHTQMDALRATIEMHRNGMCVDWTYVEKQRDKYADVLEEAQAAVATLVPGLDTASPKQLSLYFFGGEEQYKEKIEDGLYKNGNVRKKTVLKTRTLEGKHPPMGEIGKSGYYSTDDRVLTALSVEGDAVAHQLLIIRECSKIKDTYYEGLLELRFPDNNIYLL